VAWGEGGGGIRGAVRCEEVVGGGTEIVMGRWHLIWIDKQLIFVFSWY